MLFSAKAEYACLAMLELAARYGDPQPVRLADIADTHGIPQRFLVQILLQLKGGGLVASTRGAAGGYQLARPPEEIALADVLGVIDRTDATADPRPRQRPQGRRDRPGRRPARRLGRDPRRPARRSSKQTTLAELVEAGQGLQYVI